MTEERCPPVLAAVDGDRSDLVLREASRHAAALGAELVVCRVLRRPEQMASARDALRARATTVLEVSPGAIDIELAVGDPATEILGIARARGADLVVLGDAGHGRVRELFRRCTVSGVLREAKVPVLVARDCPKTNLIVVATDLVDPGFPVIEAAERESRVFDSAVVALHAIEPMPIYGGMPGNSGAWLEVMPMRYRVWVQRAQERLELALQRARLEAEPQVVLGATTRSVVRAAEEVGAELLVIGLHHDQVYSWLAARSVARPIIRRAPCSVLVVPLTR